MSQALAAQAPPTASALSTEEGTPLPPLAKMLIEQERLPEKEVRALWGQALRLGSPFAHVLAQTDTMSSTDIAHLVSTQSGFPWIDLKQINVDTIPAKALKPQTITRYRVMPIFRRSGNRLALAMADPTDIYSLQAIRAELKDTYLDLVVADSKLLLEYVSGVLDIAEKKEPAAGGGPAATTSGATVTATATAIQPIETRGDEGSAVAFVQRVLYEAYQNKASDIHFEPYEQFFRVRYRIDGMLREVARPPIEAKDQITARIKIVSGLDIAEKRVPQDGRMKLEIEPGKSVDLRVSSLPTLAGEKVVIRILNSDAGLLDIDQLGYEPDQKELVMSAIQRPYGMVLVTGPTGSGKSVSLYTFLRMLNTPATNISTVEDPVEIIMPGVNQVGVNDKAGLNFASALKSFLRQDPDIIMIGEIRDLETAEIAIKAAQTGHLVFATLHTNDAPSTLTRLVDMGVPPFNIAASVILITGQRLARKLCSCKQSQPLSPDILLAAGFLESELKGDWAPYQPVGCRVCGNSGYKGRVGVYQVMPISETTQRIILQHGSSVDLAEQAQREKIRDLRQSGLVKVKQGLTSLAEIEAITNM